MKSFIYVLLGIILISNSVYSEPLTKYNTPCNELYFPYLCSSDFVDSCFNCYNYEKHNVSECVPSSKGMLGVLDNYPKDKWNCSKYDNYNKYDNYDNI